MKKTAFLLCALLGACAADAADPSDDASSEGEVLAQAGERQILWTLRGPDKSAQQPKEDFAATVVCSNDGKGHAMAMFVVRNVKNNANYYGRVGITMNARRGDGQEVGAATHLWRNVSLPANGKSVPFTVTGGAYPTCSSMAATFWIEQADVIPQ